MKDIRIWEKRKKFNSKIESKLRNTLKTIDCEFSMKRHRYNLKRKLIEIINFDLNVLHRTTTLQP